MSRTPQPHSTAALERAMNAALSAALRGPRGANPLVGASVLATDGTLVTGHHAGAGTPHAEVEAVRAAHAAGIDLTTATMCVTLEPCTHHGRTGPCAQLLLETGVPEVVIARKDPNPGAAGGIAVLESAGVRVRTGLLEDRATALNDRWLSAVEQSRPFVTLKLAQSLDGRIAAADGTSQWITSPASRERVHRLRALADGVVVGTGTALADDPRLTARIAARAGTDGSPHDSTGLHSRTGGNTEEDTPASQPVPVVVGLRAPAPNSHLARNPRTVHLRTRDPLAALQDLHARGLEHVLVEGGAGLAGALVRADLVDSLEVHLAPVLLGEGRPALAGLGVSTLAEAVRWLPDPAADWDTAPPAAATDTVLRLVPAARDRGSSTPDHAPHTGTAPPGPGVAAPEAVPAASAPAASAAPHSPRKD
ncbi:bifunctional diaminohydroxyphosphoribosylaminopyrimidine deaminase/5-amino-6-(5-phosphoribosylamino)uracil reductase RibD [Brevibacterium sp.]|uniref:bifunctional diaminohydroxyphosphoribosylaminopyrimidine deaminase/5-amino-6-(5-phosphoribosylamino)uracil reductase RibD n=1 Tax=Brevibacterium sp. TaxID=1701 RepID=UPI0025C105CE|nr:bifunctional diaminohydroxyphosphoribosylaminopyrimidine deaminase/5-amino-6-(5-phosphoribosylamino)uracil reductase RibD [Brevibacterium sp.]